MKKRILYMLIAMILLVSYVMPRQVWAASGSQTVYPKFVGDGFEVEFRVTSAWSGYFNGDIIFRNTGPKTIENWAIGFKFDHKIVQLWDTNLIATPEEDAVIIKNKYRNDASSHVKPGDTKTIGFQATWKDAIKAPTEYKILSVRQEVKKADYTVDFRVTNDWGHGYNGEIQIRNISNQDIEHWELEFDFDKEIQSFWTASILSKTGNRYLVKAADYVGVIKAGQTLILGFSGGVGNVSTKPTNYRLTQVLLGEYYSEEDNAIPDNIQILEVTDTGVSDLQSSLDSPYTVTTMSMKKFVAMREEMEGKYDAIYLGRGTYSTAGVSYANNSTARSAANNTKNIMNDITNLKAKQIKEGFIDKGQMVILHTDIFKQSGSKLNNQFKQYRTQKKSNVPVVSTVQEAVNTLKSSEFIAALYKKPRIIDFQGPAGYTGAGGRQYKAGETLVFNYKLEDNIPVNNGILTAKLYMDTNYDNQYDTTELIVSAPVTSYQGQLRYTLPRSYSSPWYWKLEIEDEISGLKDYKDGVLKFSGEKVSIHVLQVVKQKSGTQYPSDLRSVLQSRHYGGDGDYDISIDVTDMSTFNNSLHKDINGRYNMLIFGFADVYNDANISEAAAQSVKAFIQTGQSVMFTHDTIFSTGNNWVKYFMQDTGQLLPMHDLGRGAQQASTSTKRVNTGLILQYPNVLSDHITIASTHSQYYTLDLEDPKVIPWYNISGGNRDTDDSWNHYYTYSKGTVTYSGTGHTNNYTGKDEELRLFVNTMYRAFFGANHAPYITLIKPMGNPISIKSTDLIDIQYIVEDFDLKDSSVNTKIYFDNALQMDKTVQTGSEIEASFQNPKPAGGTFTIKIEATDQQGAKVEQRITVQVEGPAASNLQVQRMFEKSQVQANESVAVRYTITAPPLQTAPVKNITNIRFTELLPPGVEVVSKPSGWTTSGNSAQGITLQGTIGDITYSPKGGEWKAADRSYEVIIKPTENRQYEFKNGKISFNDLDYREKEVVLGAGVLWVETRVTGVTLSHKELELLKGQKQSISVQINPQNASNKGVKWESSNTDVATVIRENGEWKIVGHKAGTAVIQVISLDNDQISDLCHVRVSLPVTGITLIPNNLMMLVGEKQTIRATVLTTPEDGGVIDNAPLEWSSLDTTIAAVSSQGEVTAIKAGETRIVVRTQSGGYQAECLVKVIEPQLAFQNTEMELLIGQKRELAAIVVPVERFGSSLEWIVEDQQIASLQVNTSDRSKVVILGKKEGTTKVTIRATDGSNLQATCRITVKPLVDIPSGIDANLRGYIYPFKRTVFELQFLLYDDLLSQYESELILDISSLEPYLEFYNIQLNPTSFGELKEASSQKIVIALNQEVLKHSMVPYKVSIAAETRNARNLTINQYHAAVKDINRKRQSVMSTIYVKMDQEEKIQYDLYNFDFEMISIPNIR